MSDRPNVEVIREDPYNAESPAESLRESVTPTRNAYVRTNFGIPDVPSDHTIRIEGAVATPVAVSLSALRAMPQRTVVATMECAGNDRLGMAPLPTGEPWRHGALSTIAWTGVSLSDVLALSGVNDDAIEVLVSAADAGPRDDADGVVRFARALPLVDAQRPETLLALAMNGAPLTPEHGAPVRLAVPGWYGMASVKWVTHIELRREPYQGYFQRQRYVFDEAGTITPVTRMRVKSIITSPADGAPCARRVTVSGWAWSGDGAITRVEVGIDGGDRWIDADLGVAASPHAWVPWTLDVDFPRAGRFVLRSRASDATGQTQPDAITWNRLGYGNNAIRHVVVEAR